MSMISLASMPASVEDRSTGQEFKTIVLFCCIGLVVSFGLMACGSDVSAGPM